MPKETRLDDSATIYQPREKQTEKQKFSTLTRKEKWVYFNDYYRNKLMIAAIGGAAIIYFMYSVLSPKPDVVLNVAIFNEFLDTEKEEAMMEDLSNYLGLDSENQEVFFDSSFYMSDTEVTQATMASEQKIVTYMAAGEIDIIIAEEEYFKKYADIGYFTNLADELPTEIYTQFSDSFYLTESEETGTLYASGIYLTDSKVYRDLGTVIENPILGIVVSDKNNENNLKFIKYLFELD